MVSRAVLVWAVFTSALAQDLGTDVTPAIVNPSNIAYKKGSRAVEVKVGIQSYVDCTRSFVGEVKQLIADSVRRTSSDLLEVFCTPSLMRIQVLSPNQPVSGLRSNDEVALELVRQLKYSTSPFMQNATFLDLAVPPSSYDVFSCSETLGVPFETSCGIQSAAASPGTWLGLPAYAPTTYVIFAGAVLLLCVLCLILLLCVWRCRKKLEDTPSQTGLFSNAHPSSPLSGASNPSPNNTNQKSDISPPPTLETGKPRQTRRPTQREMANHPALSTPLTMQSTATQTSPVNGSAVRGAIPANALRGPIPAQTRPPKQKRQPQPVPVHVGKPVAARSIISPIMRSADTVLTINTPVPKTIKLIPPKTGSLANTPFLDLPPKTAPQPNSAFPDLGSSPIPFTTELPQTLPRHGFRSAHDSAHGAQPHYQYQSSDFRSPQASFHFSAPSSRSQTLPTRATPSTDWKEYQPTSAPRTMSRTAMSDFKQYPTPPTASAVPVHTTYFHDEMEDSDEEFNLAQDVRFEPKPGYPTPAWR